MLARCASFLAQSDHGSKPEGQPIQGRSNGVYCVQLHLDGRCLMRSLQTRDIEVASLRAGQAMAELEAAHKAKQQA